MVADEQCRRKPMLSETLPPVLLVSSDLAFITDLQHTLHALHLPVEVATSSEQAMTALAVMPSPGTALMLLDVRMPVVASGRLLAALHEAGVRQRCAVGLIAEQVSDEWIARLREGMIDDIVPRNTEQTLWKTHVSTMQRGHALSRELEQLREASLLEVKHDPVTGALNRETLLTILFRETDRVQRLQGALSVVVFDIDGFGQINHEQGREAGNQLLREVARRAGRTLRTYDALGRMGRDEFVLALPGSSQVNAVLVAERLSMDTFGASFWVKNASQQIVQLHVSACFGIALSRGRSPVVVVREAEQALRIAKQLGAGTIRCSGESAMDWSGESSVHDGSGDRTIDRAAVPQLFTEPEVMAN
jgi:two-component system, cell cycle response regulator